MTQMSKEKLKLSGTVAAATLIVSLLTISSLLAGPFRFVIREAIVKETSIEVWEALHRATADSTRTNAINIQKLEDEIKLELKEISRNQQLIYRSQEATNAKISVLLQRGR